MGEEQQGFRTGRGTADGMFTLRQLVEKKLEGQENMALGFIDLEKAYDPNVVDIMTTCNRYNVVIHYLHNYIMVQGSHNDIVLYNAKHFI